MSGQGDNWQAQATAVITDEYGLTATVSSIAAGVINSTYFVDGDRPGVLQRMNAMYPTVMIQDFKAVTDHLRSSGWAMPILIPTIDGSLFVARDGGWWRLMSYIESDRGRPASFVAQDYNDIGSLLAKLHSDLSTLDYKLAYTMPHFHDTPYYAERLQAVTSQLDPQLAAQAHAMRTALDTMPELPLSDRQLIHGDPQTSNVLFKNGHPLTFIDYDTLMHGSIWIDLGDMLRSLAEDVIEAGGAFPRAAIEAVLHGYYEQSKPAITHEAFVAAGMSAIARIAIELGMRFLTDVAEDSYFGYDTERFSSRRDSNLHRATIQWKIYELSEGI